MTLDRTALQPCRLALLTPRTAMELAETPMRG